MKLNMFQVIRLKNGKEATIIEIFNDGEAYLVDIPLEDGGYNQEVIHPKDIKSIFERLEKPFVTA